MNISREPLIGIVATVLFLLSISATADTRIDQVWTCTLNEDHTLEELQAVHGKWIAWANKQPYGGDIRGAIAESMVASAFVVVIIDSYPDMATLAADWHTYASTKEGRALEAEYDKVSTCTSNALYSVTTSGSD